MRNGAAYTPIDQSYPYKLRGTNQGTDTGLLWRPPTYKAFAGGGVPSTSTLYFPGCALGKWALHNRAAATIVAGIGVRLPNGLWKAGQWVNATTTYTDDTTDAQDAGTDDFVLETTTNNDGFCVFSRVPFNAISINVSTASVDATNPARAVRFSDGAGAWATALTNLFIQDGLADEYALGENLIVWAPPVTWGRTTGAEGTGVPIGYYGVNVRATTAPDTTAALATALEICRLYEVTEGLADNSILSDDFIGGDLVMARDDLAGGTFEVYGDALVALFGTANNMNRVTAMVRAA